MILIPCSLCIAKEFVLSRYQLQYGMHDQLLHTLHLRRFPRRDPAHVNTKGFGSLTNAPTCSSNLRLGGAYDNHNTAGYEQAVITGKLDGNRHTLLKRCCPLIGIDHQSKIMEWYQA